MTSKSIQDGAGSDPEPVDESVFVFPVTFAQQRLLFLDQLDPNSTSYSVPWSIRMTGELMPTRWSAA